MTKGMPISLNIFTRKIKRCSSAYHPEPDNRHLLSRDHQTIIVVTFLMASGK